MMASTWKIVQIDTPKNVCSAMVVPARLHLPPTSVTRYNLSSKNVRILCMAPSLKSKRKQILRPRKFSREWFCHPSLQLCNTT